MNAPAGTILVVDDDPGIRAITAELLELSGYHAVSLPDGTSAIAWCQANPRGAALAVVDLSMPGLSGTQTFRLLRALEPQLPVIIASGSAEDAILDSLPGQGVTAVLRKPVRGGALLDAVVRALAAR